MIDLRSDTVTHPTEAMRAAMATAEVGDDVYGEDPTVNRLQAVAARAVGMEASLFVPTGSMGNLLAVKCHTQPGDEILIERNAHILQFEMGGLAWFSGVTPLALESDGGILDPDRVRENIHAHVPYYRMRTTLVCLENTHNYGGGRVYPLETLSAISASARAAGVPVHMDGARLFHAAVALGVPAAEITRHADSVMFCFSKGLSAPVGSVLCGTEEFIQKALRARRVVGGGMRQAGCLAAAALLALETMVDRLAEDHRNARNLAEGLAAIPGLVVEPEKVETNIVMCRLAGGSSACQTLVTTLR
ncbi:MAG: low specificity L-threonine aldolase, partial [Armatimonadetes bacterium]|nr:low specificity L-threonine aldolase [Armatimonadota bacterium]